MSTAAKGVIRHETALIHPDARIGEGTRIWAYANIQAGAIIGRDCKISDGCFIEGGAVLGDGVTLKNGVYVFEGITLEDGVFCGANVTFINDRYPRSQREDAWVLEKSVVKRGATLGSNATILCGVTVGEYAMVGAGAVVTRNVPDFGLVTGNPGAFRGYVCRCGRRLDMEWKCSHCGQGHQLTEQGLRVLDNSTTRE